jgi:hypothetical protein
LQKNFKNCLFVENEMSKRTFCSEFYVFIFVVPVAARLGGNVWAHMGPTYNNGDESDNWCGSHTRVPPEMLGPQYYYAPNAGIRNYFAIGQSTVESVLSQYKLDDAFCM